MKNIPHSVLERLTAEIRSVAATSEGYIPEIEWGNPENCICIIFKQGDREGYGRQEFEYDLTASSENDSWLYSDSLESISLCWKKLSLLFHAGKIIREWQRANA